MSADRVRYRISFRLENESGFHQTATRTSGTLWGVIQEVKELLNKGAEIISIKKEYWSSGDLDRQEKDTIELLTHGKVKL